MKVSFCNVIFFRGSLMTSAVLKPPLIPRPTDVNDLKITDTKKNPAFPRNKVYVGLY